MQRSKGSASKCTHFFVKMVTLGPMNVAITISSAYSDEGWNLPDSIGKRFREVELIGLEGANCYCDDDASEAIRAAIRGLGPEGTHWIDTGDYHYLSYFFLEKIDEPFQLVLFDNHPDDQEDAFGAGLLSCGGWVRKAEDTLPMMKGVLWNSIDAYPSLPVFLSIDIDVLAETYARTDWDQGTMSLEKLLSEIMDLKSHFRIIGVDICGGITTDKGGCAEDFRINLETKARIIEAMTGVLESSSRSPR